jgi:N-acetylneuraminic acid mutarotase
MPSTLDRTAEQLAAALKLLDNNLAAGPGRLLRLLGWELPPGVSDIGLAAIDLSALIDKIHVLESVKVSGTDVQISGAYADLAIGVADALAQLRRVAAGFAATPDYLAKTNIVDEFFPRLVDFFVMQAVAHFAPAAIAVGQLCGIFLGEPHDADPAKFQSKHLRHVVRWDRLGTLLTDPVQLFREVYGWGTPGFDASGLVANLGSVIQLAGVSTAMRQLPARAEELIGGTKLPDGADPSFQLFVSLVKGLGLDELDVGVSLYGLNPTAKGGADGGFGFSPYAHGTADLRFPLTEHVVLTLEAEADLQSGVGLVLRPEHGPVVRTGLNGAPATVDANVFLALRYETPPDQPLVLLDLANAVRLDVKALSAGAGIRNGKPVVGLALEGGHLVIDASGGDGFLTTVLGGARIESKFDLSATFSPDSGLQLGGTGGLELEIPGHLELGPVEVRKIYLALGIKDGKVPLELSAGFSAALGPITASIDRMGVLVDLSFPDGGGNIGPAQLDFGFKPPNGVGLAVDAGLVSGGGFLYADPDRGEYAGALELEFAGFVELKAIGLISTRMPDGSPGFSLLIVITTEFGGGGIQLGYGFTLLAVGGLIGLNRGMNLQALVEGVRTGSIQSVMFPRDVVANAPRILSDLRTFFPPEQGKFLIGPMAKLGWGTPTLVSVSLGVIVEIPPGTIAILGVLKCALPTEELALLVLQVNFIGAFEPDKQRLWFFAQLFDSRILFMTIDGGMGLLVAWGDSPDLVLTVGGFHPSFTPPPLPFPVPDRLSIDIINQPGRLIRVSGYFAVTSNTVQFGAKAELRLGFADFGVEGHLSFDALFRFSPFAFTIDISAGVSLKAFGVGLFGIDLRFQLEGPAPWRAHGRGSISLLFFEISADFDITWGEEHNTTLPPVAVLPLLVNEIKKREGWQTRLPAGGTKPLVTLRTLPETDQLVLHPLGTLFIRQRAIPLDVRLDRIGEQRPSDGKRFSVAPAPDSGLVQVSVTGESFAMAQFQDMDDAAKLSRPAYENQDSGLELTAAKGTLASARAVRRSARYEQIVIDKKGRLAASKALGLTADAAALQAATPAAPRKKLVSVSPAVFGHLLKGSSTSRSPLSRQDAQRRQPFAPDDTVRIDDQRWVIAYVRNNRQAFPPSGDISRTAADFRSQTTASDALAEWVHADATLAGKLHVIKEAEVTAALAVPGTWAATDNPLPVAGAGADAVLLAGGRVFLAGGEDATGTAVADAALFDPVTHTWSAAKPMTVARSRQATTRLPDGRVLLTGGVSADGAPLSSAEIYDPVAATWSTVDGMTSARAGHSATALTTGQVLIAGGTTGTRSLSSAELFDPASGKWVRIPGAPAPMTDARSGHQAVALADGRVLVTGGLLATGGRDAALAYCELYDPATRTWTPVTSMVTPRAGHQATLLADGRHVLVTGGDPVPVPADGAIRGGSLDSAELFVADPDPAKCAWQPAGQIPAGRSRHGAALLRTGEVLVLGGTTGPAFAAGLRVALRYDPAAGTWTTSTAGAAVGRWEAATVVLADGRVLTGGGLTGAGVSAPGPDAAMPTATAEIFTP